MKNKTADLIGWLAFCFWLATMVICLTLLGYRTVNAQTWDWSPPATHHAAVCRVASGGRGGSGIYVQHGELRGVLTAAHISEGQQTIVTWSDGTKTTGKSTVDKFGHDVAFIFAAHSALLPISMAGQNPRQGDRVEFVVSGGPENRLRRFWATIRAIGDRKTEYDCDVLSGDSGGGILNIRAELIGIQAFGFGENILTAWNGGAYRGSGSASCGRIRDFLGRVAKSRKCGPEGCPVPPTPRQQFYPPAPLVPVQKPARRPIALPSAPLAPVQRSKKPSKVPPGLSVDYKKLVDMILLKIDSDDFRGPVGPPGPHGPQGADGTTGKPGPRGAASAIDLNDLAKRINKRIKGSIRVKVRPFPKP